MSAGVQPGRPPVETIRFPVAGMTCASCASRITRAIKRLDGVTGVRVDLRTELVTVRRAPALVSDAALVAAVGRAGYQADLGSAVLVSIQDRGSLLSRLFRRAR